MPVPVDVTDRAAVIDAAQRIEHAWGGIDLAIFNAGGSVDHDREAAAEGREAFRSATYTGTMALNYFSVVYGIEAVLPDMLARGSGHVAAVASLGGYRASASVAYGASKAAVIHLMEGLRFEVAERGVGVTVINPGFVKTPLTDPNRFHMPFLLEASDAAERIVRGLERGKKEIHFPAALSWPMKMLRTAVSGSVAHRHSTSSASSSCSCSCKGTTSMMSARGRSKRSAWLARLLVNPRRHRLHVPRKAHRRHRPDDVRVGSTPTSRTVPCRALVPVMVVIATPPPAAKTAVKTLLREARRVSNRPPGTCG